MTNLDKIERKIREAGEKEIEAIEKETEKQIEQINKEIEAEAVKAYNDVINSRSKEIELVPRRIISDARMEKRRRLDLKKNEIVEKVFSEACEKIMALSREEKAALLKKLAENGARDIKDPVYVVDREYADMLEGAKAENLGVFGVVVRSKDGTSTVDNTLPSVIQRLKLSHKPAVVKILFGGD